MFLVLESLFTKKLKILLQSNGFLVFLLLFVCLYVFFFTQVVTYHTKIDATTKELEAKLVSFSIDGDKLSMELKQKEKILATYYIKSKEEKEYLEEHLKMGLHLRLVGKKSEVLSNTIPNTFDYKDYLYHERIYFTFSVLELEILDTTIDFFSNVKNSFIKRLEKLENDAYIRAFVLGDKTLMDADIYQNIVKNGVSHLFALSGMHLSLVYLVLSKFFSKCKRKKLWIYLFLLFYLFLTGCSVSFLRAILFLFLLDCNKKWGLSLSSVKVLFLTACILLFWEPFFIYNVGFWYTFVVTFSLLFCRNLLKNKGKFKQILLVSIITFLFGLPISLYINYEVNLFSVFNNILFVPFISTFVFPLALLTFFLPFLLPIFQFLTHVLEGLNQMSLHFVIPIVFGKISLWEVVLAYLFLLIGFGVRKKKYFFFFLLLLFFSYHKNIFDSNYHVYFLDVGQGDATLFVAPRGKEVILIDTGGKVNLEKKEEFQLRNKEFSLADIIVTFLKSIRVRKISLLLLTHGDLDHLGYAEEIGESIPYQKVLFNHGELNDYEKKLVEKYLVVKGYSSKYFHYTHYFTKVYSNENDNSLITRFCVSSTCFLMMGDVSKAVEKDLMNSYSFSSTFLKVGHHGSNTSSSLDFLKFVQPHYAIISSGRNNRYHHPSKETIENLEKLDITIFNTQNKGTIEIRLNKKGEYHIFPTLS